jgi:hypothetical protein
VAVPESRGGGTREPRGPCFRAKGGVPGSRFRAIWPEIRPPRTSPRPNVAPCGTEALDPLSFRRAAGIVGSRRNIDRSSRPRPPDATLRNNRLVGHSSGATRRRASSTRLFRQTRNPAEGKQTQIVGGVAEWSKAAVLKTAVPLRVPGVRIPPPPQRQNRVDSRVAHTWRGGRVVEGTRLLSVRT